MELTRKCKEDFEKWYMTLSEKEQLSNVKWVYELPQSMQYGVYVDFFDSVGLLIDTDVVWNSFQDKTNYYEFIIKNQEELLVLADGSFDTRQEAREQAIKKANEIYNSI